MTYKNRFSVGGICSFLLAVLMMVSSGAVVSCEKVTGPVENPGDGGGNVEDPELAKIPAGISHLPAEVDADGPLTVYYKAKSSDALKGYSGDVYIYTGAVYEDNEWRFMPAEWGVNTDKCKAEKLGDGVWKFSISTSVREWYGSGETPLVQLGFIFRSADGNKQTKPDYIIDVIDNKYEFEPFEPDPVVREQMPEGVKYGINYTGSDNVTLVFYDKDNKGECSDYCYAVGDFSGWERKSDFAMKRDDAAGCWWTTISGLDPNTEYRFEYFITRGGETVKVGDPYTEIVYDQWNDKYLSGVRPYPETGARGLISAFQINRPEYTWKHRDFRIEDKNDLVIYELLFRDFSKTGDIKGAAAQLDYLQNLGVTAIELMPVQEFDGNESWGYNPNHYFALDKAYGTRKEYKEFIDECHGRGMAVIIDVVYNHATGTHPWAKLYWDGANNRTAQNNPWFNVVATHPYSVFHDWNHENTMVRDHIKESLKYLLEEYDVDGFRFDLSKGFTQKNTGSNVSAWSGYDASRIAILRDYYDCIQSVNPDAVMILEHLGDRKEENELSAFGAYPWRKCTGQYANAVKGNRSGSSFTEAYANGYVAYMESHDEQRICYGATGASTSADWGICGTLTGWGDKTAANFKADIKMSRSGGFYVAKGVEFEAGAQFKIRESNSWEKGNLGASGANKTLVVGEGYKLLADASSKNLVVSSAGSYDVYLAPESVTVWLMKAGAAAPTLPDEDNDNSALAIAMRRAGCCAAFFLTVPGPKMIWQFGELGYDISGGNGDTDKKPVMTEQFLADKYRKGLYDTYAGLLKFRRENPRFFDRDAEIKWYVDDSQWDYGRFLFGYVDGKRFAVIGNFTTSTKTITAIMPAAGTWKDYSAFGSGTYTTYMDGSGNNLLSFDMRPGDFKLIVNY